MTKDKRSLIAMSSEDAKRFDSTFKEKKTNLRKNLT